VKTFPQNEQDILEPLGILSILVIPLRVGDEWYGLIGFDATVKPRLWNDEDIRLLQTAARMVEAYLERMQANEVLSQAKEAAEAANQAKSTFLSSLSHELRTALNAIIGSSEMLEEDAVDSGYDDSVPNLKRINNAGRYLSELINNILDLSKIEAGKMELYLETFAIASVIDTVKSTIQPLVEKKHNTLSVQLAEGLGCMHADATKTRQVLVNLFSNAAKFTEKGQISSLYGVKWLREWIGITSGWQIQALV
jgi:signal transduction histidine kinase